MNSKISVFVLAAGMGSRYGGLKQMEGFGPNGETLIDYSIYDAINAGFDQIVFVIRPDMEESFKEIFIKKYEDKIEIKYVFQTLDMLPEWYEMNPERTKPWGTAHATLVAKDVLKNPFLIINGDDFYGSDAFKRGAKFLREECSEKEYGIVAYRLGNVLSDHGTVKRGICESKDGYLTSMVETFDIQKNEDGRISGVTWDGLAKTMQDNDLTNMNMFAVHNNVFDIFEKYFEDFLKEDRDPLKGEFLLPIELSKAINNDELEIKVVETSAEWFGVTYPDDAPIVREKLKKLVEDGVYPEDLLGSI